MTDYGKKEKLLVRVRDLNIDLGVPNCSLTKTDLDLGRSPL